MTATAKVKRPRKPSRSTAEPVRDFGDSLRAAALAEPDERLRAWVLELLEGDARERAETRDKTT